jgi:hypothetical protein
VADPPPPLPPPFPPPLLPTTFLSTQEHALEVA